MAAQTTGDRGALDLGRAMRARRDLMVPIYLGLADAQIVR